MKKVEVNISIKTTPSTVIQAFTDYQMLKDWWQVERAFIQLKAGGLYTLTWNVSEYGFGYVSSGIIQKYDPQGELTIGNFVYLNPEKDILGPMALTVRATENNGITDMYICQDGYQSGGDWDWYYEAVCEAWPKVAEIIKDYLENK